MAKGKAASLWLSMHYMVEKQAYIEQQLKELSFSLAITFSDEDNDTLSLVIDRRKLTRLIT